MKRRSNGNKHLSQRIPDFGNSRALHLVRLKRIQDALKKPKKTNRTKPKKRK